MNYIKTQYKQPQASDKMLKVLAIMLSAIFFAFISSVLINIFYPFDSADTSATILPTPALTTNYTPANQSTSQIEQIKIQPQTNFITGKISRSLFVDGQQQHVPINLLQQLTKIFSWQINFSKDIQPGDSYSILYEKSYDANAKTVKVGAILAAEFINQGIAYQAIRYTNSNGEHEYYSPSGANLEKAFLRYPIKYSRISSQFSLHRHHPLLHKVRPHFGVDLAAPIGTPIHAASKGKIVFIGRKGSYGNLVKIKHGDKYTTLYAHMQRFYKGLDLGSIVDQGQIIGYVGQSGLADGPHLHYEFLVNKKPVNPLTISLPKKNSIPKTILAKFKSTANVMLAQLQLYHDKIIG